MKLLCSLLLPSLLLGSSFVHATTITQVALGLIDELKRLFRQEQTCEPGSFLVKGKPFPSLLDVTLDELTTGLESGLFTSVDLVKTYIDRINEVNDVLHAVTEINPEALSIAAHADALRANGTILGPLHGIPILIKNNIATDDQMNTSVGSHALLGAKVPHDSTMAAKLRKAGAVILGKANQSQWSFWRSRDITNGWSAVGGQVHGVYYPKQDPAGSSSGSGVASAIGLAPACLGTETDGSIIMPSERSNIVGIKPTVGLTSRYLVVPISEHQDTVGPMARTVKDAATILQAIAGPDPNDNYTSAIPNGGIVPDYVAACNYSAFQGARIGIPRNVIALLARNTTAPITAAFDSALALMRHAGATLVDNTTFSAAATFLNSTLETQVLNADFMVNLATYLSALRTNPAAVRTLADVAAFTRAHPHEGYPGRGTSVWDAAAAQGWNNSDGRFWAAYTRGVQEFGGAGGLLGALAEHRLDAVVLPSLFASRWAALVGAPVVHVPLGFYPPDYPVVRAKPQRYGLVDVGPNVPFGLSFLGARFAEEKLIGFAYAFEQRTMVRGMVRPYIVPSVEIGDIVGR